MFPESFVLPTLAERHAKDGAPAVLSSTIRFPLEALPYPLSSRAQPRDLQFHSTTHQCSRNPTYFDRADPLASLLLRGQSVDMLSDGVGQCILFKSPFLWEATQQIRINHGRVDHGIGPIKLDA